MQIYDTFWHLLNYNTQNWMPKIECHTQAASGCFHLTDSLSNACETSTHLTHFLRLKPGSDFAGWGCWVCSICMFACTYPILEVPNSSKFITVNILYSIIDICNAATAYQNTNGSVCCNSSRPDWPKLVRQWIVLVASERRQQLTWKQRFNRFLSQN